MSSPSPSSSSGGGAGTSGSGSGSGSASNIAAAATTAGGGRWYVESDDAGLIPVDLAYNGVVEGALRRGDASTTVDSSLIGSHFDYTVHFLGPNEAVQTNDITGRCRTLRRYAVGEYVWQYLLLDCTTTATTSASSSMSSSSWRTYPNTELLEDEYSRNGPSAEMVFTTTMMSPSQQRHHRHQHQQRPVHVHIDMGALVERNVSTGTTRAVRRVSRRVAEAEDARRRAAASSSSAAAATSSSSLRGIGIVGGASSSVSVSATSASSAGGLLAIVPSAPPLAAAAPPPSAPPTATASSSSASAAAATADPDAFVWRRVTATQSSKTQQDRQCPICHEAMDLTCSASSSSSGGGGDDVAASVVVELRGCSGHYFHLECVRPVLKLNSSNSNSQANSSSGGGGGCSLKCPLCSAISGTPHTGCQPPGTMTVSSLPPGAGGHDVRGLEGAGVIVIDYRLPSGIQGPDHPSPGVPYSGTSRRAYLPDTSEGREVLRLLTVAWERKLIFTVGTSVTTGRPNCVVWAGIHHKTCREGGTFGYPDETYLARVKDELKGQGIS